MTQTEKQNVPSLRFPGFEGEWRSQPLSNFIASLDAGVSVNSSDRSALTDEKAVLKTSALTGGIFRISENKAVCEDHEIERLKEPVQADTIIVSRMNTPALVGENAYVSSAAPNVYLPDRLWAAKSKATCEMRFLAHITGSGRVRKSISDLGTGTSGSMKNIGKAEFLQLRVSAPTLSEQRKIAEFLGAVDERIAQVTREKALLEDYKTGSMQQLFSQSIRFKDKQGNDFPDWEEKPLETLLSECVDKSNAPNEFPVLSSTKNGVFLQEDYFRGRVASSDNTGYKILRPQQVVLSPQNLWLGNINFYDGATVGIVSPSYKIFDVIEEQGLPEFVRYMIRLPRMLYEYGNASEQGASVVRRNLDMNLFNNIPISLPHPDEQRKIADFLSAIDAKIDLVAQELEQAKTFKKGLLQQMFV